MNTTPTMWAQALGAALRAARHAAGLTQDQLAVKLGCARNTVSNAERGEHQLSDELAERWWEKTGFVPEVQIRKCA